MNYKPLYLFCFIVFAVSVIDARIIANQLGLIINDNDPYSTEVGAYYQIKRGIPSQNVVHIRLPVANGARSMTRDQFETIKTQVYAALPSTVEALAISWTYPYLVDYNSITSAFAYGFRKSGSSSGLPAPTCALSYSNPYYDKKSTRPFKDYKIRPSMMLAAYDVTQAKALIDRGVASDGTVPRGKAYLMVTGDNIRNVRARKYDSKLLGFKISSYVNVTRVNANEISGQQDSLFYFGGTANLNQIGSNQYPKGAIADHLTSYGGVLGTGAGQTNILEYIKYGLTGSYGTGVEPCAYTEKFPNPAKMIKWYTVGDTLVEAYWKSVKQPYEGVFVGEPLANPWGAPRIVKRAFSDVPSQPDTTASDSYPSIVEPSDPSEEVPSDIPISYATSPAEYSPPFIGDCPPEAYPETSYDSTAATATAATAIATPIANNQQLAN